MGIAIDGDIADNYNGHMKTVMHTRWRARLHGLITVMTYDSKEHCTRPEHPIASSEFPDPSDMIPKLPLFTDPVHQLNQRAPQPPLPSAQYGAGDETDILG